MNGYKDMTFCSSDCANKPCHRYFGEYHRQQSRKWWGGDDPPVAWSDFSGDCPDYIAPRDKLMYSGQSDRGGL